MSHDPIIILKFFGPELKQLVMKIHAELGVQF
jgi:hypothetical protein